MFNTKPPSIGALVVQSCGFIDDIHARGSTVRLSTPPLRRPARSALHRMTERWKGDSHGIDYRGIAFGYHQNHAYLGNAAGSERKHAIWSNILDLERDDIAASQLAVDGWVEYCRIARPLLNPGCISLELV